MKTLIIIIVSSVVNSYTEQPPQTLKETVKTVKEIKFEVKNDKDPALKKL